MNLPSKFKLSSSALLVLSLVAAGHAFAAPKTYTAKKIDAGSFPSGYNVTAVSPNGKKYAGTKSRSGGGFEAWYYNGSSFKTIPFISNVDWSTKDSNPPLGCRYSYYCEMIPTDINNNGDIVGQGKWDSYYTNQDHVWISRSGGKPGEIKATTNVDRSFGASLNAYGNIVFTARQWPTYDHHAMTQHVSTYKYNSGAKDLGTLKTGDKVGKASWASSTPDIKSNSSRPVVGYSKNGETRKVSYYTYDVIKGFIYKNGKMTELPAFQSTWDSKAHGINKYGVAVGEAGSRQDQMTYHAVKWVNGKIIDLNIKPSDGSGLDQKKALHITDDGTIHGIVKEYRYADGGRRGYDYPFVYKDGVQKRLMDLVTSGEKFLPFIPIKVLNVNPNGSLLIQGKVEGGSGWGYYHLTPN